MLCICRLSNRKNNVTSQISSSWESHLRTTGCHQFRCHTILLAAWLYISEHTPTLTPVSEAGTRFTYPGRMEGWVDLGAYAPAGNRTRPLGRKSDAPTAAPLRHHKFRCVPSPHHGLVPWTLWVLQNCFRSDQHPRRPGMWRTFTQLVADWSAVNGVTHRRLWRTGSVQSTDIRRQTFNKQRYITLDFSIYKLNR